MRFVFRAELHRRGLLAGHLVLDDGLLALFLVERAIDAEHALGLIEEDVSWAVADGAVSVVHRPAEGRRGLAVAVAADREMVTGEDEAELFAVLRFAEHHGADAAERAGAVEPTGAANLVIAFFAVA